MGRQWCIQCNTSLVPQSREPETSTKSKSSSAETIGGWVGLGLAIFGFQMAAPHFFTHPIGEGINWLEVACAAAAGAVGIALGRKIGSLFSKK
ncbi:MAG: hypothetical protein LBV44_00970 [Methylobacillus sp.]|nr:hypothetical protein [Methylobacillus sp.]